MKHVPVLALVVVLACVAVSLIAQGPMYKPGTVLSRVSTIPTGVCSNGDTLALASGEFYVCDTSAWVQLVEAPPNTIMFYAFGTSCHPGWASVSVLPVIRESGNVMVTCKKS